LSCSIQPISHAPPEPAFWLEPPEPQVQARMLERLASVISASAFTSPSCARACRIRPASSRRLEVRGRSNYGRGAGQSAVRDRETLPGARGHHNKVGSGPAGRSKETLH
jgi:hypothetical protein